MIEISVIEISTLEISVTKMYEVSWKYFDTIIWMVFLIDDFRQNIWYDSILKEKWLFWKNSSTAHVFQASFEFHWIVLRVFSTSIVLRFGTIFLEIPILGLLCPNPLTYKYHDFQAIFYEFWKSRLPKKNDYFEKIITSRVCFMLRLNFNELSFASFQVQ